VFQRLSVSLVLPLASCLLPPHAFRITVFQLFSFSASPAFSVSAFPWDQGHVLLRKGSAVRRLTEEECASILSEGFTKRVSKVLSDQ
jgi:hypothetical protein